MVMGPQGCQILHDRTDVIGVSWLMASRLEQAEVHAMNSMRKLCSLIIDCNRARRTYTCKGVATGLAHCGCSRHLAATAAVGASRTAGPFCCVAEPSQRRRQL